MATEQVREGQGTTHEANSRSPGMPAGPWGHPMPAGGWSWINPGRAHFATTPDALSSLSLSAATFAWIGWNWGFKFNAW